MCLYGLAFNLLLQVRSDGDLDTCSGERVYLLGDVRSLMREFTTDKWKDTKVFVTVCVQ